MQSRMQPEDLTNEMINEIGKNYLAKYPTKSLRHSHQAIAQELASYSEENESRYKWFKLAATYRSLYTSRGELTTSMDNLINSAFSSLAIETISLGARYTHDRLYSVINAHYNNKMYDAVRAMQRSAADAQPAASHLLSSSSPLRTTAPAYPNLAVDNQAESESSLQYRLTS
jgi:hypothetical protein